MIVEHVPHSPADLAYMAAVIDNYAKLTTRKVHADELPMITIQGKLPVLPLLAEATGVSLMRLDKDYTRHQCSEHCPDRHMAIESWTHRWQLTGARATVVLFNVEPYLRMQGQQARALIEIGQRIGFKTNVINDMARLGWEIPELRRQPRARLEMLP